MKFKGLAAAIFVCFALANMSIPANAEQIASHSEAQYQPLNGSTSMTSSGGIKTSPGQNSSKEFDMLDMIGVITLAVAGLMLLRKIQGE